MRDGFADSTNADFFNNFELQLNQEEDLGELDG